MAMLCLSFFWLWKTANALNAIMNNMNTVSTEVCSNAQDSITNMAQRPVRSSRNVIFRGNFFVLVWFASYTGGLHISSLPRNVSLIFSPHGFQ